jgi:hypothetical protein
VLVFIEHRTRRVYVGGVTAHPTSDQVQQTRNLVLDVSERSGDFRFLIRDRGPNVTAHSMPSSRPRAPRSCALPCGHRG